MFLYFSKTYTKILFYFIIKKIKDFGITRGNGVTKNSNEGNLSDRLSVMLISSYLSY